MRLEPHEADAVRRAAREAFGESAVVRVFGSRADDAARGGDLDLYVEVDPGRATLDAEFRFLDIIERPLDELRVDLLVRERDRPPRPIERIALRDGIVL